MKRKSILKALLLTVLMCCLTFALVACGGKHTVTFNYGVDGNGDGEVDVVTVEVGDGSLLEEPTDVPTREGYTFVGWGTDNGMWNFEEDTVTSDLTLTARWSAGDPVDPGTPGTTFYVNYELGIGAAEDATTPDRQTVTAAGTTIKLPAAPAAGAGWEFTGWLVSGETELRAPESDYTVNGTVTITAQWKSLTKISPEWDTDGLIDDRGEVLKDLVGTYTPAGGGDITVTIAKDVLSAAMQTFLENAEEEGSMATTPETGAFHAEEKAPSCLTDGTGTLYYTVYYQVPETSLYVEESVAVYTFPISAQGHFCTNWNVTVAPTEGSTGTAQSVCTTCGNTVPVTLPKFTETNVVTEETELAEGYYFKETKRELTCEQDGIVDYQYMFTSSDLTNAKVSTSDSTENTVSFTVTTPATGHDYPETATRQENKFVVNCNNNCGENYTLTITFANGGGTGDAPDMSSMTVSFDKEAMTFSFTTPASCPFTAPASNFFDGWRDGENTYGNSAPVTVPATAEASITLTAQWTTEHTHRFTNNPHYDAATGKVVITCALCDEEKLYEVTGISLDDGAPSSFVVTDTAVGTAVTLPEGFTVNARGSWETDEDSGVTTAIAIPASELTAEIATNAFKNATITVMLKDGVTATVTGVTLLTQKLSSGNLTVNTYTDRAREIGTFTGEFEIRYTLSNIQRNTQNDQISGGPDMWNSWLLTFVSNGKDAVLREDNFMVGNFGRGDGVLNTATETTATEGMQATLQVEDELSFVVTRTYDTDAGVYELTIVISGGEKDITVTITEPGTLGNVMTVYLAGEDTAYDYSAVNAADEQIAMTGIEADNVSVAYGTELNNVSLPVYGVYGSRAVKDLIASGYTLTCDGYSATTPDTYTVTVKYSEFEEVTAEVTVEEESTLPEALANYSLEEAAEGLTFTGANGFGPAEGGTVFVDNDRHKSIIISESVYEGKIANGITINLWANPTDVGENWEALLSIYDDGAAATDLNKYQHFRIGITGLDFGFNGNEGSGSTIVFSGGGFDNTVGKGGLADTAGKWTMYTLTISTTEVKVYVNGVLQRTYGEGAATWGNGASSWSAAKVLEMLNTYSNGIRLGSYWPTADLENDAEVANFAGTMRDASLYASVLDDSMVSELYNSSKADIS